jgi:hypothetical protein
VHTPSSHCNMPSPYVILCAVVAVICHVTRGINLKEQPAVYLCAIAKAEDPYIEEWVTYHLLIGFEQIHIYDNNDYDVNPGSGNITKGLREKYPNKVYVHPFPGHKPRPLVNAFMEFAYHHHNDDVFTAFLDVDEFLVLGPHICVHDMLRMYAYEGRKSLGLGWIFFGSNGHKEYEDRPVTERFTMRERRANPYVKVIAYCPHVAEFNTAHDVRLNNGKHVYDLIGNVIKDGRAVNLNMTEVAVHHFAVKSLAEYKRKLERGQSSSRVVRDMAYFHHISNNSRLFDDSARRTILSHTQDTCRH